MADRTRTNESYPTLTARAHWGRYSLGILTEVLFILGLAMLAYVLSVIAVTIW